MVYVFCEYQLVAKSTVPCFLTLVIFTMSIFSTVVCPGIGGTMHFLEWGGTLKKFPGALRRSLCPQLQNRVGAYESYTNFLYRVVIFLDHGLLYGEHH